jgi:methyl-accepting chemotaxis protein
MSGNSDKKQEGAGGQKRKTRLINRSFQFELMAKFIVINTVILVLFGALIYIFFRSEVTANLASAHAVYRNMSQMLMPIVLTLSVINILLTAVVIAGVVLYSSHRIAGPLYRFNEALKAIAAGNLAPLTRIRDDDQLQEVSISLGQAADRWTADIKEIKRVTGELKPLSDSQEFKEKLDALERITGGYGV